MGVLQTQPHLQRYYLPSTENVEPESDRDWVMVDVSPLKVGDLYNYRDGMSEMEAAAIMLAGRIQEWSYTVDETSTERLEITKDTIALLDPADFGFLQSKIVQPDSGLPPDEKKSLPDTSPESVKVNVL